MTGRWRRGLVANNFDDFGSFKIGRLLAGISASVLADTTVIFLGDNGTPRGVVEAPFDSNRAKGSVCDIWLPAYPAKKPTIDMRKSTLRSRGVKACLFGFGVTDVMAQRCCWRRRG